MFMLKQIIYELMYPYGDLIDLIKVQTTSADPHIGSSILV